MYENFANYYDALMGNADYGKRCEYLLKLFEKFGRVPHLCLDLACGTGGFSLALAKKGVSVIGVDISPDMLTVARQRSQDEGLDVLYLCQNATDLDLFGTVDGAICCLDSINHITDYEELTKAFSRVSLFLEPDCLFIFDVNTVYKHEHILANNTFVIEKDNVYCVWQNEFDKSAYLTYVSLDFFERINNRTDTYIRSSDYITERAYTPQLIDKALKAAGLKTEAVFEELSFDAPKDTCERTVYVTRKL